MLAIKNSRRGALTCNHQLQEEPGQLDGLSRFVAVVVRSAVSEDQPVRVNVCLCNFFGLKIKDPIGVLQSCNLDTVIMVIPDGRNSQVWQACSLQLPSAPCSRQHFQNYEVQENWRKVSLQVIVVKLPCLGTRHPQPAGRIAVDYKCPPTVVRLKVQFDFQESEIPKK